MRLHPMLVLALFLAACKSGSTETSDVSVTSAASSASPSPLPSHAAPAATAAPQPAASASEATVLPTPVRMAAGKPTTLDDVGLTIAPAFPYTLEDQRTHWTLDDTSNGVSSIWVMRKTFSASSPLGAPLPCANPKEGAAHAEPDGSFTYRCRGSARDDGTWFARLVPTTNATYPTVQCQGRSTSPQKLKLIEETCRSIKKL